MSKKSKRELVERDILKVWERYITDNPDALKEYFRLREYIEQWRHIGRFYYSWHTEKLLPIIQEHANKIKGNYTLKEMVDTFRKYYDKE